MAALPHLLSSEKQGMVMLEEYQSMAWISVFEEITGRHTIRILHSAEQFVPLEYYHYFI